MQRSHDFYIEVDIFEIVNGKHYLINTIDYDTNEIIDPDEDTETQTQIISGEWVPYKQLQVVWYFSDGLTISYITKNGLIFKKEEYYEY